MRNQARGMTLNEGMATLVVLSFGLLGTTVVVLRGTNTNRQTFAQQQAYAIAERELERIVQMGCVRAGTLCSNLATLEATPSERVKDVHWSVEGAKADGGTEGTRPYHVVIDVDPPFEGAERGSPPVDRMGVINGTQTTVVNVRVTVSWDDDGKTASPLRVVSLQTRISP
ncbi:MAG: type IV pilus modification PilV family protein [Myxococcaceae bacterium]